MVDKDNNFVTITDKTNTFLSTKIDEKLSSSERIDVIVKLIKNKIDLTINRSRLTELEELVIDKSLDDFTFVYMYKLDDDEKAKLIPVKTVTFYYINRLPILDIFSSSIARLITSNYIVYLTRVPNPPSIIFTYPASIIVYRPVVSAPILVPSVRTSTVTTAPVVKRVDKTLKSEIKSSPKRSSSAIRKRSSSSVRRKRSSSSVRRKRSSSAARRKRSSSAARRKRSSSAARRRSSSAARRRSSSSVRRRRSSAAAKRRSSSPKAKKEFSPRRELSRRRVGGEYYEKYMKYKTKYLELKKQIGGAKIGDQIQLNDKSFHMITGQDEKYWILSNGSKIFKNMENITWVNNTIQNRMIAETYINNNKGPEYDIEG